MKVLRTVINCFGELEMFATNTRQRISFTLTYETNFEVTKFCLIFISSFIFRLTIYVATSKEKYSIQFCNSILNV